MNQADSDRRIDRIEAELAIRALAARYCFAIDDHDLDAVGDLFTDDARVWSRDGVMDAQGRAAIVEQYRGRFAVLGPSNHVSHDHWIRFGDDPDLATGLLSAHAELYRNDTPMVTALRYTDEYRRVGGQWRIADRQLTFLYYVPLADYPGILGAEDRMRAYAVPAAADYPEGLPGWRDYRP
ncbi:nuclear transport factor 2 family protein [Sphingomonas sp.]|uniref:nuclear transport factor 2 family protein n=1 Tax=Sphingomonas sp. TaxID=28214 RepID=UPI002869F28D|nr:nuclear transport factor 2 family protein [Sphingomonas sp.]